MLHDGAYRAGLEATSEIGKSSEDIITELGWTTLLIDENFGGASGTLTQLAEILEGLSISGKRLPVIERCALVPTILRSALEHSSTADLLAQLCTGEVVIAPLLDTAKPVTELTLTAKEVAGGYLLEGHVYGVESSGNATHYLVLARLPQHSREENVGVFVVPCDAIPKARQSFLTLDGCVSADFELSGVVLETHCLLTSGAHVENALFDAQRIALLATSVSMVTSLGVLIDESVKYLNQRKQFGVPLSSFQALRHMLADVYVRYQAARALLGRLIHDTQASGHTQLREAQLLKLMLGETARVSSEVCIQMHGAMGMSEEVLAARLAQHLINEDFRFGDRYTQSMLTCKTPALA